MPFGARVKSESGRLRDDSVWVRRVAVDAKGESNRLAKSVGTFGQENYRRVPTWIADVADSLSHVKCPLNSEHLTRKRTVSLACDAEKGQIHDPGREIGREGNWTRDPGREIELEAIRIFSLVVPRWTAPLPPTPSSLALSTARLRVRPDGGRARLRGYLRVVSLVL